MLLQRWSIHVFVFLLWHLILKRKWKSSMLPNMANSCGMWEHGTIPIQTLTCFMANSPVMARDGSAAPLCHAFWWFANGQFNPYKSRPLHLWRKYSMNDCYVFDQRLRIIKLVTVCVLEPGNQDAHLQTKLQRVGKSGRKCQRFLHFISSLLLLKGKILSLCDIKCIQCRQLA